MHSPSEVEQMSHMLVYPSPNQGIHFLCPESTSCDNSTLVSTIQQERVE